MSVGFASAKETLEAVQWMPPETPPPTLSPAEMFKARAEIVMPPPSVSRAGKAASAWWLRPLLRQYQKDKAVKTKNETMEEKKLTLLRARQARLAPIPNRPYTSHAMLAATAPVLPLSTTENDPALTMQLRRSAPALYFEHLLANFQDMQHSIEGQLAGKAGLLPYVNQNVRTSTALSQTAEQPQKPRGTSVFLSKVERFKDPSTNSAAPPIGHYKVKEDAVARKTRTIDFGERPKTKPRPKDWSRVEERRRRVLAKEKAVAERLKKRERDAIRHKGKRAFSV